MPKKKTFYTLCGKMIVTFDSKISRKATLDFTWIIFSAPLSCKVKRQYLLTLKVS